MPDLIGAVCQKGEDRFGAHAKQGEADDDELGHVRQLHHDPVPRGDTTPPESGRHPVHLLIESGIGDTSVGMDERDAITVGARPFPQ